MAQRHHVESRASAVESKFYLPAGSNQSTVAGRLERVWATIFDNGIETP
jgi:hypothetical protein